MNISLEHLASRFTLTKFWKLPFVLVLSFNLITSPSIANPRLSERLVSSVPSYTLAAQSNNIAQMEDRILHQINEQRHNHGLVPLQLNRELSLVARSHSQQMANRNFYSHIDHQGRNHRDRVEASGLKAYLIGENLMKCIRASDPAGLSVQSWMDSPAHRKNILLTEMTETGVGIWQRGETYYVTQIYMEPK